MYPGRPRPYALAVRITDVRTLLLRVPLKQAFVLTLSLVLLMALLALGTLKSTASFVWTGSMQESDVVLFVAGFMTTMLGLLAEVIVAHQRR